MSKRVLLIGENISSFIMNAIYESLQKEEYDVSVAVPEVNALGLVYEEKPDFVIVYAGEYIDYRTDAMIFLKNYCEEQDKKICLIGHHSEIETLKKVIPDNVIWNIFERPLNVKELVERLNEHVLLNEILCEKKQILIIDDSGIMLRTIKSWLTPKYKVAMASSAAMAISYLANNRPDLILLDYEMPVCSGPQFMEMIRAEYTTHDIPVMFLTAKGDKESVQRVLDLKPAGYLLKTMSPEQIMEYIDRFFEKSFTNTL